MTNLEFYKDEIKEEYKDCHFLGDAIFNVTYRHGYKVTRKVEGINNFIDWLLEEHKELIKLKKWEYDLLSMYHTQSTFNTWNVFYEMKQKGYFKGVKDQSLKIDYILENCEIVPDDYDFGEKEEC